MGAFEDSRPNPDDLLRAVKSTDSRESRGRLKIYLGMSAGVGKTFAMLRGAQELRRLGRSVLVGLVETHGRAETLAEIKDLPLLARRKLLHQGIALEEFDLDQALAMKPDVLLLDELAHTNVPGSRHAKRWQDVFELLEAGIEVHTTLNVQHLESRADSVEMLTGVKISETVPDSLLDAAQEIVVIDLDPYALLKRLDDGKIYPAERARTASENFFRPESLTALREIALRVTADRVDQDLQTIHKIQHPDRPWRTTERLLVAVYASPYSELMIRRTRLLATTLDAPWFGAYIESGRELSEEEKRLLNTNLALVRELGGEVLSTLDDNPAHGLLRLCRDHNITQIVVGKSRRPWWKRLLGQVPTEQLLRESHPVDIYVVAGERRPDQPSIKDKLSPLKSPRGRGSEFLSSILLVGATALLCHLLLPTFDYRSIGLIFLLPVLVLSLMARPKIIWFGTLLSALVWDFFFMPPFHTLSLQDHSDYVLLAVYFAIAIVTGTLTAQLRRQRGVLQIRERRASTLYRLSKALAVADSVPEIEKIASSQLFDLIGAPVKLLIKHASEDRLESSTELGAKEHAVADWVLKNAKPAGKFTETLPAAAGSYFPLTTQQQAWGVLALVPLEKRLSPEMRILVESVCGQIALAVQKERLRAKSHLADLAGESDRLSRSLLNVVSHELKTPITAILSAAQSLENRQSSLSDRERELFASVAENGRRLSRIVDHLLETNRLEAGKIEVRREAVDLHDVVAATLRRLGHELEGRPMTCDLPSAIPLLETDEVLLATVLRNLLHNAAFHTPPGSPIQLVVEVDDKRVILRVLDEGPGFASDESEKLFEKFYRGANAQPGGTGLGLPLARGLAESLGGTLVARNRSPKGSEFELTLPLRTPR